MNKKPIKSPVSVPASFPTHINVQRPRMRPATAMRKITWDKKPRRSRLDVAVPSSFPTPSDTNRRKQGVKK